jgi:hypothetical protein
MPALAGIQGEGGHVGPPLRGKTWIPVFTGMTEGESTWSRGLFSYLEIT